MIKQDFETLTKSIETMWNTLPHTVEEVEIKTIVHLYERGTEKYILCTMQTAEKIDPGLRRIIKETVKDYAERKGWRMTKYDSLLRSETMRIEGVKSGRLVPWGLPM